MSNVTLQFLGATQTVTGSRFLIATENSKVLVDAGLFQGPSEVRQLNWEPFPVDPSSIDAIILTHAHLDHCGYLPLLVKQGFTGKIHCTKYTRDLAEVVLLDSAHIQEEDAKYADRKGYSSHKPALPLYTIADAQAAVTLLEVTDFRSPTNVTSDVVATFHPSGHILGSAFMDITAADKRFLFTGDMGRPQHPALVSPDEIPVGPFNAIVTESTYGDRVHETPTSDFADIINATIKRGGSILIPAFAVDRTEVILMKLRELSEAGHIPRVPIYVDSPMALTSLQYYRDAITDHAVEIREDVANEWQNRDPFDAGELHEMRTVEQSKSLNDVHNPCIVVSASGMATGGRVVHHLAHMLPTEKNTILLVGYQGYGTRGRQLADGATEVTIHGEPVPVRAEIEKVEAFSVHADGDELISWLKQTQKPHQVFVVHGEPKSADTFAKRLHDSLQWNAIVPKPNEVIEIS